jgi:hypothetical protein
MDFIKGLFDTIGTPQLTWAMIFAVLGYLGKSIVDHYLQNRKIINEINAKTSIESQKEQETVKISILSQILLTRSFMGQIFHQILGHAEPRARGAVKNGKYTKLVTEMPFYPITQIVLGIGRLLAQLNNFQTYQYMSVQAGLMNVDLISRINEFEETLSKLGVFRGYQKELSLFSLQLEKHDFSEIIKSKKVREKTAPFLASTITLAEKLENDFIEAWARIKAEEIQEPVSKKKRTSSDYYSLSELGIDFSIIMGEEYLINQRIEKDVSKLKVNSDSVKIVKSLFNLYTELQSVFDKLNKDIEKQKTG